VGENISFFDLDPVEAAEDSVLRLIVDDGVCESVR
jgi:hypothetical protein